MSKNLLVTGTDGFIGSNFAANARAHQFNVYELNRKSNSWDAERYREDLILTAGNIKFDSVIHLGAIASTMNTNVDTMIGFNVEAVQILANFCSGTDTPLIFVSSAAVYGNEGKSLSLYAKTKIQGEEILRRTPNLQFTALRLFNTYGFNEIEKNDMKSVISDIIISGIKNQKISIWQFPELEFGSQSRDFIFVHDVIQVITSLIRSKRYFGETLDLGSGHSYKFIDLANFIISIEKEWFIESIQPPKNYQKNFYQQYTCANNKWITEFLNLKKPKHPFEIIPDLIDKYKIFIN
jgi:ADP-L-glycero-D-manno-heptose 6-epimerase